MRSVLPDLQELLDAAARRHRVPGAAVAVGHDGRLDTAATGVLNLRTGVTATPDSLFQIGSVTKVWTSALVMQLVDEGLVDLDQPVRRYLPTFAVADPEASATVTVRHLLTHACGFAGDLFEDTGRGEDALPRYVAYLAEGAGQVHPPGALYSYCNSGFAVAGALIASLRGDSWETVLRERLMEPLGVTHMALLAEEAILFRAAAGHVRRENGYVVASRWQLPRALGPAAATVCAAPADLVRFGRLFVNGGDKLLSPDAVAAMATPQVQVPGVGGRSADRWGLGVALYTWDGVPVLGHDGGTVGQHTVWRVIPSHDLVVAMNANGGAATAFFDELLDPVVKTLTGLTVPPRPVPPPPPRPAPPSLFAGRYAYPLYTFDVTASAGGLSVTTTAKSVAAETDPIPATARYVPLTGDTFIAATPSDGIHSTITFVDGGRYLHDGRAAPRIAS